MEIFVAITDLALELNPNLPDQKDAEQAQRRTRIISMEDVKLLELPEKSDDNHE